MIKVVFFGVLGDIMGRERIMELGGEPATIQSLIEELRVQDSGFNAAIGRMRIKIALNSTMVSPVEFVTDGDEIAILPPFSGG